MSSSMLSFNPWLRALRLPAGIHVWHGLLALAALVTLWVCGTFLIYMNPKAAATTKKWVKGTDAQILFLGNSQQHSLHVGRLCRPALNISVGGSDYSTHYAILRNLAPRLSDLTVVVLAFDNLLLSTTAIAKRNGDYEDLMAWGVPWWDVPEVSLSEGFFFLGLSA